MSSFKENMYSLFIGFALVSVAGSGVFGATLGMCALCFLGSD